MDVDVEKVIRGYLPEVVHMSLGTSRDNKPWVCEVHFAYDEDLNLYFRSKPSRRHSHQIAENSSVAGNIVKQHAIGEIPAGIYFEGTAEMISAGEEQQKAATILLERLRIPGDLLEEAKNPEGPQFYKIRVDNWYAFGRFENQPVQKYKLEWSGGQK